MSSHNGRHPCRRRRAKIDDLATHDEANLTAGQLAEYWGVNVQTVRKWVREGDLRAILVGHAKRVKRADAERFERSLKCAP